MAEFLANMLKGRSETEKDRIDLPFPKTSRISAGFAHNLVIDSHSEGDDIDDTVWGFGSNRNHMLGLGLPPEEEEEFKDVEGEQDRKNCCSKTCELPVKLRFGNRSIAAVCCGANHSVFLEKRPQQPEGDVWTLGLGTNGRLGVLRPNPQTLERHFANNTWMPSVPKDYSNTAIKKARGGHDLLGHEGSYMQQICNKGHYFKWSLREPVRVHFPGRDKIARIACGVDHTLAITSSGIVYAWGLGSFGNIGNGTTSDAWTPVQVKMPPDTPCIQVVAGMKHSMALTAKNAIYSWGHGGNGRLGQGMNMSVSDNDHKAYKSSLVPEKVATPAGGHGLKPMVWIAAGEAHSASIDSLGNIYCWGAGSWGRTGHGEETDVPAPQQVSSLNGIPCTQVELGSLHTIALTDKGSIYGWGSGPATGVLTPHHVSAQKRTPEKVRLNQGLSDVDSSKDRMVEIAAGAFHSIALKHNGEIYAWGKDQDGRLGLDTPEKRNGNMSIWYPQVLQRMIMSDKGPEYFDFKVTLTKVISSRDEDSEAQGQLALEDAKKSTEAEDIARQKAEEELEAARQEITCGGMSSSILVGRNEVWIWGSNEYGQLGLGHEQDGKYPEQVFVDKKLKVAVLACGLEHCIMVMEAGSSEGMENVWTWGRNCRGQLGRHTSEAERGGCRLVPQLVPDVRDAVEAAAGEDHSAVILASGELYTWGSAECGKLGVEGQCSTGSMSTLPTRVKMDCKLKKVSCGAEHTAAISTKGDLYTFGAGWFGRLGHGTKRQMANSKTPLLVENFCLSFANPEETIPAFKVDAVHCASFHTCAVDISGRLWICGRDSEVMNSDHVPTLTLLDVFRDPDVRPRDLEETRIKQVAVCAQHTFVLSERGTLWTFGDNSKGQLGIGNMGGKLERVKEPTIVRCPAWGKGNRPKSVATGVFHSLVLMDNGDAYAMGLRVGGRLALEDFKEKKPYMMDRDRIVPQPAKVSMYWVPTNDDLERDAGDDRPDATPALKDKDEDKEHGDQKKDGIPNFQRMQEALKKEQKDHAECTKAALKQREEQLSKKYRGYFENIVHLWDKPSNGIENSNFDMRQLINSHQHLALSSEWTLRRLQDRLDRSVCTNLQKLGIAEEYPNLENNKVHKDVAQRLLFFEELLWLLQQQPCYLAKLSDPEHFRPDTGFHRKNSAGEELLLSPGFFTRIITNLFRPLANDRIRHLYMALVRIAARKEIQYHVKHGRSMAQARKSLFHPNESTTCLLINRFVKDPYEEIKKALQLPLVGEKVGDGDSLIVSVESWTSEQKEKQKNKKALPTGIKSDDEQADDALFALELDDLEFLKAAGGMAGLSKKDFEDKKEELKHNLNEHQKTFQFFLDAVDDSSATEAYELLGITESAEDKEIEEAFERERKKIQQDDYGGQKEFKLSQAKELLLDPKKRAQLNQRKGDATKTTGRKTFRHFLWNSFNLPDDVKALFTRISNEFRDAMSSRRVSEEMFEDERKKAKQPDQDPMLRLFMAGVLSELLEHHESFMTADLTKKMKLRCTEALRQSNALFDDASQAKTAQKNVDLLVQRVHFNMRNLGKFIRKTATMDFEPSQSQIKLYAERIQKFYLSHYVKKQLEGALDPTETMLTIDLYTSHYDIDDNFVQVNAIDLLELGNALWLFKDKIVLVDKMEEDKLYDLLNKIQPKLKAEKDDQVIVKDDEAKKTRVSVIAETANEDGGYDGEIVLMEESFDNKPTRLVLPGFEPGADVEDFEEAALRNFEQMTGCVIMGSREARLLNRNAPDDPKLREGVFVIRATVSQPAPAASAQNDIVGGKKRVITKPVADKEWLTTQHVSNELEYQALLKWTQQPNRRGQGWNSFKIEKLERELSEVQKRFWQKWELQLIRDPGSQHNFRINHRFLESQRDLCFCRDCEAPIPRSISPQNQRGRTELRLIKIFRAYDGDMVEGRYPFLSLEEFLANSNVELIKKNEYIPAKYELEEMQKNAVHGRTTTTGNVDFPLAATIDRAKKDLELLRSHNIPESRLVDYVIEAVRSRKLHYDYLREVEKGAQVIEDKQKKHMQRVKKLVLQLHWSVQASQDASIPDKIRKKAEDYTNQGLSMQVIEKEVQTRKQEKVGQEEPLLYPAGTFSLGFLRSKRVISRVGDGIEKSEYRRIFFNFQSQESGVWLVRVMHKADGAEHLLMVFEIPVLMLEDMKRTGKTEKKPLGKDESFIFNCFSLVQLLARISSNV
mmetsp:Transcript_53968/g.94678  ORF Transcript_53968/g.94678 Transcript_53968/m.94678 type:complete len:2213 (-) Transcript_53968:70-6708(-)